MSLDFKLKFDQMRDSAPANKVADKIQSFDSPGSVRNLCFIWPDGKMKFLNYAYLISGSFEPEENRIALVYTTETVFLKGINLLGLYADLSVHLPKSILCIEQRYAAIAGDNIPTVFDINVVSS